MGLAGMIGEMMMRCDVDLAAHAPTSLAPIRGRDEAARRALARLITALESGAAAPALRDELRAAASAAKTPVVGITGTGGAGKSSLTDELIRRLRLDQQRRAADRGDQRSTRRAGRAAARCSATASA